MVGRAATANSPKTAEAEVTVLGGGLAGLVVANRLAQLGRKPLVLEKGADEKYFCNSRFTGGAIHICYRDPMSPAHELREAIEAATAGTAAPALADAVATDSKRFIRWLQEEGISFARGGFEEYKRWVLTPLRPQQSGLIWEGRGGDVMLRLLEANLVRRGGQLLRRSRVTACETSPGNRWMIKTEAGLTLRTDVLVIADGGFQANSDLVSQYISPQPTRLLQRGAATGCGDGLRIARSLGAGDVGLDRFYGHVLTADALTNAKLWPYPWMDPIVSVAIVVDSDAERFVDESKGGVFISNAIARLADPLSSFAIFDDMIWKGPGASGVIPPNPHLRHSGGRLVEATTIENLGREIGLAPDKLARTVSHYNAAIAEGTVLQLHPPRGAGSHRALPIMQPPFYAGRLCAGITYTMGGIAIDGYGRALRPDGSKIEGLYAAGTATGGLEGGPNGGYVGGLAKSGVTAMRAAESIAQVA
jgi:fumarate reductase flavoprotein subunit